MLLLTPYSEKQQLRGWHQLRWLTLQWEFTTPYLALSYHWLIPACPSTVNSALPFICTVLSWIRASILLPQQLIWLLHFRCCLVSPERIELPTSNLEDSRSVHWTKRIYLLLGASHYSSYLYISDIRFFAKSRLFLSAIYADLWACSTIDSYQRVSTFRVCSVTRYGS